MIDEATMRELILALRDFAKERDWQQEIKEVTKAASPEVRP